MSPQFHNKYCTEQTTCPDQSMKTSEAVIENLVCANIYIFISLFTQNKKEISHGYFTNIEAM